MNPHVRHATIAKRSFLEQKVVSVSGQTFLEQGPALRDLKTLEVIARTPSISQRDLAQELGIALGLANACLARMTRTGLIRISRINGRSLAYHLTPAGFTVKAKLSAQYVRTTIDFYHTARQAVRQGLGILSAQGISRIGLVGTGDVAEIVGVVCAHENISIVCIADDDLELRGTSFMGLPVVTTANLSRCGCQAVIVSCLDDVQFWMTRARSIMPEGTPVIRAL